MAAEATKYVSNTPANQTERLDLPTPEGWQAELT